MNTTGGSEKSARVITFDDEGNIVESAKKKRSQLSVLEMVDLKPKAN